MVTLRRPTEESWKLVYKDNEGSEISETENIQGILFLESYKNPIFI